MAHYTITELYDGVDGAPGKGITSVTEYYLASASSTGVTTGTAGWTTAIQTITTTLKYLWNYRLINYSDGSSSMTNPVVIGVYGNTGGTGPAGKGVTSITQYYLATNVNTGVTTSTVGWTTTAQTMTTTNCYLWSYQKITYSDATTANSTPVIIGAYGNTGATGKGISSIAAYYLATSAATGVTTSTTGWTTTVQTMTSTNKYLWNYEVITYTDSTTTTIGPSIKGVYGNTGNSGTTTYTWAKYADDIYGGNMADSPTGKRYIGMAFNKTTATESTNASDYLWSPLYDNVKVGGRNIFLNSALSDNRDQWNSVEEPTWTTKGGYTCGSFAGALTNTKYINQSVLGDLQVGETYTISGWIYLENIVKGTTNYTIMFYNDGYYDNAGVSTWYGFGSYVFDTTKTGWQYVTFTFTAPTAYGTATSASCYIYARDFTGNVYFRDLKLEKGNISTDWSPSPEDVQAQIDYKADTDDLLALGQIVADVSSEINAKAGQGDLDAMVNAYNARITQDDIDKQAVSAALATIDGRTTLVETLAGNSKIVTDFINTVITESAEGIYISNKSSSTGILIASDRISFLSNNVEVAYISNQTMQINHGIFVQSATIANFKFEALPSAPTILAVQWVGG